MRTTTLGAGFAVVTGLTLFNGLGAFGLLGPDEPRYAAIARAMAQTGDWITPRLWGAPWFEKPVLYYWLAAFSDSIARGAGAVSSRLPNSLLTLALIVGLALFLRRAHSPRAGWLAAFMGVSSAFIIAFGRAATTDMTLTAPLALGLCALYLWTQTARPAWLGWAAAAIALATLAKGPVAVVLAALTLAAFAATQRRWSWLAQALSARAVCVFLLITAPWYIAVQWRNPGFFRTFFLQHNLERFATNRFDHPQPVWFYLPLSLLAVFPWSGFLGLPLAAATRRLRRLGWRRFAHANDAPLAAFLTVWLLVPIAFFSISRSKLPGYILPSVPAAIGLMAICAADAWEKLPRWALAITAVLAGPLTATVWLAPDALAAGARSVLHDTAALGLAVAAIVLLLILALRRRTVALLAATAALVAAAVVVLTSPPLAPALDATLSARPLARQLAAQCDRGLPSECGTVPLYTWNLNRSTLYGLEFNLDATLAEWPVNAMPDNAIVLVDRAQANAFADTLPPDWQIGVLSRLQPASFPNLTPWVALRVRDEPH